MSPIAGCKCFTEYTANFIITHESLKPKDKKSNKLKIVNIKISETRVGGGQCPTEFRCMPGANFVFVSLVEGLNVMFISARQHTKIFKFLPVSTFGAQVFD